MSIKQLKLFMTNVFLNAKINNHMYGVASCFIRVIELNQTRVILLEFVAKNVSS
jgi:hypothetical protein